MLYSSESLAVLIAFSHDPLPRIMEAVKKNRQNLSDDSRTEKRVLLSMNNRDGQYVKRSQK